MDATSLFDVLGSEVKIFFRKKYGLAISSFNKKLKGWELVIGYSHAANNR